MATVINNPQSGDSNGILGFVLGLVFLGVVVWLFVVYAVPALRSLQVPSGTQINVPSQIDVNVKTNQ